jgi:beta-galactosidase
MRCDDVVYQPGELKVVVCKNGKEWATDTVRTAEAPAKLALSADRSKVRDDGIDLSFITVHATDAAGIIAPGANDHIKFTIDGPGEIVATDNGDPTSFERFPAPERNAFNGPALVVVRTLAGRPGTIRVSAQSGTLPRCRAHRSRGKASPRPGKQRYSLQRYPEAQARLQH